MTTNQSPPSVIVIDDDTDDENIAMDITPIDHKRKFELEAVKDADEYATIKCQKTTEEFLHSQTESLEALDESSESESEEIIGTQKLYDSGDDEDDDDGGVAMKLLNRKGQTYLSNGSFKEPFRATMRTPKVKRLKSFSLIGF